MKQDGHDTYQESTVTVFLYLSCRVRGERHLILRPVDLSSVEDRSLPVAGSTVSTVGMDPLFRRLRGVLSAAPGPKVAFARSKLAESGRNTEQSIRMVQTLRKLSPQPPETFIFREAMHGYARGIAGVFAADFISSTCYAVLSTMLDSTLSHIVVM